MAGGVGLLLHIIGDVSLPLAVAGLLVVGGIAWLHLVSRMPPAARQYLRRRVAVGACAGFVATLAYDAARYGTVALFSMSFDPFHVLTVFGELFIGQGHGAPLTTAVGVLYHVSNGTFFGVAYCLLARRPSWWTGALWGIALELCMAFFYPPWLRIVMLREFLEVSALGHIVYGSVLGLGARWMFARRRTAPVAIGTPP